MSEVQSGAQEGDAHDNMREPKTQAETRLKKPSFVVRDSSFVFFTNNERLTTNDKA
jgi:hypothetical protein